MKLLLDVNISYKIAKNLGDHYEEIAQAGRLGMSQTDDAMIWQFARSRGYILVTFEPYFQERNLLANNPIKIIWLRFQDSSTKHVEKVLNAHYQHILKFAKSDVYSCLELYDPPPPKPTKTTRRKNAKSSKT